MAAEEERVTMDDFRALTARAGLALSPEELEELKPLCELYMQSIRPLRSLELKAEEIGVAFSADWPPS